VNIKSDILHAVLVGLDPGITTGLAVLDTYGNVIILFSKRNIKRSELIKLMTKFGKPILIACDVSPPPRSVEKISRLLGCRLFFPEKSLSVKEKIELTKNFPFKIKNDHERDALAAVVKAWKKYRNLFRRIEENVRMLGLDDILEDVAAKLLKDESINIDDAIKDVIIQKRKSEKSFKIPQKLSLKDYQKLVEDLKRKLRYQDEKIKKLNEQSDKLNHLVRKLRYQLNKLKSEKIDLKNVYNLREELKLLRKSIELWKKFRMIEKRGFEPLIEIEKITGSELEKKNKLFGLQGRVILCNDKTNLNLLNNYDIKAVIIKSQISEREFEKLEFPIIIFEKGLIKIFNNIKCVDKKALEEKIKKARKVGFIKWLESYKKRKV
jgi:hypothetical protein